jgi:hypothetical protein
MKGRSDPLDEILSSFPAVGQENAHDPDGWGELHETVVEPAGARPAILRCPVLGVRCKSTVIGRNAGAHGQSGLRDNT